jgi:NTE family protein
MMPEADFPIITGVSAGGINAAFLAARKGSFQEATDELTSLWENLTTDQVFLVDPMSLAGNLARWLARLASGGASRSPQVRSMLDTSPLRDLLRKSLGSVDGVIEGVGRNLQDGRLGAFSLTTLKFSTGQTVTWVQGCDLQEWKRPNRRGIKTRMTVDHIMASAALPLAFPAIEIAGSWYGDGGVRMYSPLAPAIHLGADKILAVSTRYPRSYSEADKPAIDGYPPPAQIAGTLMNAVFLDAMDQDAHRLEQINRLLDGSSGERSGLRPIRLLVLRPSQDLGRLAAEFEPQLPRAFRFLTRGLGTRETSSPDFLSLLMFQPDYLTRLMEIGERDAEARRDEVQELLES